MEQVKRVFAFLGLAWVINVLFYLIFPEPWLRIMFYCEIPWLWLSSLGAWRKPGILFEGVAPSVSIVLLTLLAELVVVWAIKNAQLRRG